MIKIILLAFLFWNAWIYPLFAMVAPIPASGVGAAINTSATSASVSGTGLYQFPNAQPITATNISDTLSYFWKPSILAYGPMMLVTAASIPASASTYLYKESNTGISTDDIKDWYQSLGTAGVSIVPNIATAVDTSETQTFDPAAWPPGSFITQRTCGSVQRITSIDSINYTSNLANETRWLCGMEGQCYQASSKVFCVTGRQPNGLYNLRAYNVSADTGQPPLPPPYTQSIDPQQLEQMLRDVLANYPAEIATAIDAAEDDRRKVVGQSPPASVPVAADTPAITPQEIRDALAQNTDAVLTAGQSIIDAIDSTTSNPVDAAKTIATVQNAVDQAQAQQQAVDDALPAETPAEVPDETFTDVPLSGFANPYNPGPFDIPDRFDTFLANVAGTGLFSLPSQYFNSLPGGGSPTYTIEAGTYGTHTVDLSETMGTGLTVLKTVLLLCFAFLSIRVVVLKR